MTDSVSCVSLGFSNKRHQKIKMKDFVEIFEDKDLNNLTLCYDGYKAVIISRKVLAIFHQSPSN